MNPFRVDDIVILHRPNNPNTVPRWIEDWDDLDGKEFRVVEFTHDHKLVFLNREGGKFYVFPLEWLEFTSQSDPIANLEPSMSSFLGGV